MLRYIENSFSKLELKTKIELFLLINTLFMFSFYLLYDGFKQKNIENTPKAEITKEVLFKGVDLNLLKKIESFAKKNKIIINEINNNKNSIFIKSNITLKDIVVFIHFLENINGFSSIKSFRSQKKENNIYNLEININFEKYYIKNKPLKEKDKKENNFKLFALIDNYALINNHWLKKGEFIDDFELIEMKDDFVRLKAKEKEIILKLWKMR